MVIAYDAVVSGVSLWLAYYARYNFDMPPQPDVAAVYSVAFAATSIVVFFVFGVDKGHWRFASLHDFQRIVAGSVATVLLFVLGSFFFSRLNDLPRSVPAIAGVTMILFLSGSRAIFRGIKSRVAATGRAPPQKKLLILGTVGDAESIIRRFGLEANEAYQVVGILAFSRHSVGLKVRGAEVLGEVAGLADVLEWLTRRQLKPDVFLIATPGQRGDLMKSVIGTAVQEGVSVVRMARRADVLGGGALEENLEPVNLEDLLGRPPVRLEVERIRTLIRGRTLLVTGGGGSIGSEIVRQVAAYGPRKLVILDNSEFALYQIDAEVAAAHPDLERVSILASVCDREAVERAVAGTAPDLIFHAAALKHVPLVEHNVCEGVRTNLIGTRNMADAAAAHDVKAFVMISTDKAVRPTSVMGASKRAAEAYCQALDLSESQTLFVTVRFGNVLGSNGSVVPLFERQIRNGGPVTVTHPEMQRYFMTIREATELVLQASVFALAEPERRGGILILDMGKPVKIIDLARTMIAMAGKRPEVDVPIVFTGLRRGEKLFEELFDPNEVSEKLPMDGLAMAKPRFIDLTALHALIAKAEDATLSGDVEETLRVLKAIVPEYNRDQPGTPARTRPQPSKAAATLAGAAGFPGASTQLADGR